MRDGKTRRKTIWILSTIIAILALFIVFFLIIQPSYYQFVGEKQIEGIELYIENIINQLETNGYVQIPTGNQTIILVPYVPPQGA